MKYLLVVLLALTITGCGLFGGNNSVDMGGEAGSTWRAIYEATAGGGFLLTQKDAVIDTSQQVQWQGTLGYIELPCGRFGYDIAGYDDAAYWATQPITVEYQSGTLTCALYTCTTSNVNINLGVVTSDFECVLK